MLVRRAAFVGLLCAMIGMNLPSGQAQAPPIPPPGPVATVPPPLFTDSERAAIVAYWNAPERMTMTAPAKAQTDGPFVVRLTVAGSEWLLRYKRAVEQGGAPPSANPLTSDFNPDWKLWLNERFARDRYLATQTANTANASVLQKSLPPGPAVAVTNLSTIPAALLLACGNPPPFANVVAPILTRVTFAGEMGGADRYEYEDNVAVREWYPYYRYASGTVSYGKPLSLLTQREQDDLFRAAGYGKGEQRIMSAVSPLEGGFDSINTYDTGFVSVGFLQFITWNDGRGSLSDVLLQMKRDRANDFTNEFRRFGVDVNALDRTLTIIDPQTGAELRGLPAVLRVIEDKRLTAVFQRAGRRTPFRVAQIQIAKKNYWPASDAAVATVSATTILSGKVSDIIKSEAGLATLFDRKINQGTIVTAFNTAIGDVARARKVTKFGDLAKFEREIVQKMRYRADFLDMAKYPILTKPK